MFQKLASSEGVGLEIEKILDDFTWNDPSLWLVTIATKYVAGVYHLIEPPYQIWT